MGHQRGRAETLEADKARWEVRMDTLQLERDQLLTYVATSRAQMVAGGGMDAMWQRRAELVELWERARFYRGRYHTVVPVDQIEHYRNLTMMGIVGTCTSVGAHGGSDWSVGGTQSTN